MRKPILLSLFPVLLGSALTPPASANDKKHSPPPPVSCAELATEQHRFVGRLTYYRAARPE